MMDTVCCCVCETEVMGWWYNMYNMILVGKRKEDGCKWFIWMRRCQTAHGGIISAYKNTSEEI